MTGGAGTEQQRDGVPAAPVVGDSACGEDSVFRETLDVFGLDYMLGVHAPTTVYTPLHIRSPKAWLSVLEVGNALGRRAFKTVRWREGSKQELESEFGTLRVRAREDGGAVFRAKSDHELWLLIEWPKGKVEPSRFFFSNRPATEPIAELVLLAKCRNWIEPRCPACRRGFPRAPPSERQQRRRPRDGGAAPA